MSLALIAAWNVLPRNFRRLEQQSKRRVSNTGKRRPTESPIAHSPFKTTARSAKVRMDHEVREAITGHPPATVGDDYGEMPVDRMWEEICRLPRFEVQPPTGPLPDTPARWKRNAARVAAAERAKARRVVGERSKVSVVCREKSASTSAP